MINETLTALIDETYALAHVLNLLFEEVENAGINVNPHAVAAIAGRIADNIVNISHRLHDNGKPP
ncbi:MAG: hypothetical protein SWH61_07670 [Thermodesulfobacteriota bacterium]|nr:hypothetical protein [Thermodesulfobacteriota bacterium]